MIDKRIAMSAEMLIAGTSDNEHPRGMVFDSAHTWSESEIFDGLIGENKFVPKAGDLIVDVQRKELKRVVSVDATTQLPTTADLPYDERLVIATERLSVEHVSGLSDKSELRINETTPQGTVFTISASFDITYYADADHAALFDDLNPYQSLVPLADNLTLETTTDKGVDYKKIAKGQYLTGVGETALKAMAVNEKVSLVVYDADNKVLGKRRLSIQHQVIGNTPPVVTIIGDSVENLNIGSAFAQYLLVGDTGTDISDSQHGVSGTLTGTQDANGSPEFGENVFVTLPHRIPNSVFTLFARFTLTSIGTTFPLYITPILSSNLGSNGVGLSLVVWGDPTQLTPTPQAHVLFRDSGVTETLTYTRNTVIDLNTEYSVKVIDRDNTLSLYLNGVLEKRWTYTGTFDNSTTLMIGREPENTEYWFKGSIKDVSISGYADRGATATDAEDSEIAVSTTIARIPGYHQALKALPYTADTGEDWYLNTTNGTATLGLNGMLTLAGTPVYSLNRFLSLMVGVSELTLSAPNATFFINELDGLSDSPILSVSVTATETAVVVRNAADNSELDRYTPTTPATEPWLLSILGSNGGFSIRARKTSSDPWEVVYTSTGTTGKIIGLNLSTGTYGPLSLTQGYLVDDAMGILPIQIDNFGGNRPETYRISYIATDSGGLSDMEIRTVNYTVPTAPPVSTSPAVNIYIFDGAMAGVTSIDLRPTTPVSGAAYSEAGWISLPVIDGTDAVIPAGYLVQGESFDLNASGNMPSYVETITYTGQTAVEYLGFQDPLMGMPGDGPPGP